MNVNSSYLRLALWIGIAGAVLYVLATGIGPGRVIAQQPSEVAGPSGDPLPPTTAAVAPATHGAPDRSINLLKLASAGGIFMIPIFAMSGLVVTMTIERFLALRRSRVLPEPLIAGLGQLGGSKGMFDPRKAYRLCQQFPSSAAASVVRVMLLRVGRPLPEIEAAVQQASQREADKLYANVRWLNLAASLAVMLGLIGTIQGMIIIFHQMQVMDPSADRASTLAGGIYTKLVCTFSGLSVAIPAAFFSHYFEGRIQSLFREIDELLFNLLPQLERFEGRLRFNRHADANGDGEELPDESRPTASPPPPPRQSPPAPVTT